MLLMLCVRAQPPFVVSRSSITAHNGVADRRSTGAEEKKGFVYCLRPI